MVVRFRIPEVIARYTEGRLEVDLEPPRPTVGAALEALFDRFPALRERVLDRRGAVYPYLLLYQQDEPMPREGLDAVPLEPGAALELIAAAEGGAPAAFRDIRMQGFQRRTRVDAALSALLAHARPLPPEEVDLADLALRVLAEDVESEVSVPPFARAAMDGYAVRAEDTYGASAFAPARLALAGEALPGATASRALGAGEAIRIMTGAPVPAGADAVVMAERTSEVAGDGVDAPAVVLVTAAVSPWKHVGRPGEDIERGTRVLARGRRLRPQDLGVLASIGRGAARVVRRPRVRVVVTGDELVPAGTPPGEGRIVDSNTPMLAALLARDGALLEGARRTADDRAAIAEALLAPGADAIVCTGGTSVGREDWLPQVAAEHGELFFHGIACRPAAPAGGGRLGEVPIVLLPGNPVACLAGYDLLAGPLVRALGGRSTALPYRRASFPLARKLVSELGRLDYVRVRIDAAGRADPLAAGGASILSSTTTADGFALVAEGSEGLPEGAPLEVYLYDDER